MRDDVLGDHSLLHSSYRVGRVGLGAEAIATQGTYLIIWLSRTPADKLSSSCVPLRSAACPHTLFESLRHWMRSLASSLVAASASRVCALQILPSAHAFCPRVCAGRGKDQNQTNKSGNGGIHALLWGCCREVLDKPTTPLKAGRIQRDQ